MRGLKAALSILAGLALFAAAPAGAQDAAGFFKGKTIRFLVGYGPGGGYDAYARMLAPHLSSLLEASVVVQNMPGAGGLNALNSIYGATGDATEIMIVNGTAAALSQLLDDKAVRYDLTKISNLGLVSSSPWIWVSSPKSSFTSPADFLKPGAKPSWGGAGQIDGLSDGAAVTCMALKMDCKIVRGYEGSAQVALALNRGEVDALYVSDTSANQYVGGGGAKAMLTMSREKSRFFPNLPTVFEAMKLNDEQKWWFEFRETLDNLGRILVAAPGLQKDQLLTLQNAVRDVLSNKAVIDEGEKSNRYISYRSPEETQKMVSSVLTSISPQQKKLAQDVILKE